MTWGTAVQEPLNAEGTILLQHLPAGSRGPDWPLGAEREAAQSVLQEWGRRVAENKPH